MCFVSVSDTCTQLYLAGKFAFEILLCAGKEYHDFSMSSFFLCALLQSAEDLVLPSNVPICIVAHRTDERNQICSMSANLGSFIT